MTATRRDGERKQGPALTSEQARTFGRYSVGNAAQVMTALSCGCEPYVDVFTFGRWIAQGYAVQKGQKALRLSVVRESVREDKETGELTVRKVFVAGAVFCRCQVAVITTPATAKGG